jgi:hypothetical protein
LEHWKISERNDGSGQGYRKAKKTKEREWNKIISGLLTEDVANN